MATATRKFAHWKSFQFNRNVLTIEGSVDISAAAAVTSSNVLGGTWTKQGTGVYRLTLERAYQDLHSLQVSFQSDTDVDLVAQIDSSDVTSNKYIDVKLLAAGTATDPSAACKLWISLRVKK